MMRLNRLVSGPPRSFRTPAAWAVAAGLVLSSGCSAAGPADGGSAEPPAADQADASVALAGEEPIRLTEVPPPPGIDPRLLASVPDALRDLAGSDLEAVLTELDTPPFLELPEGDPQEEAAAAPAPPPLAAQQLYAAGRQAFHSGDNFLAVQQYEKALRLSPRSNAILHALGRAWAVAGNRVSAADYLRQAYQADRADAESLLLLGRFALENRQWDEAIVVLAAARKLEREQATAPEADPADRPLISFLLANALTQAGYAEAALAAYRDYLEAERNYTRQSMHGRELMVIDAQRAATLVQIGDLHHRLDQPEAALDAYQLADEADAVRERGDDLLPRLLYTRLRLGQTGAAGDLAVQAATRTGGPPGSLVRYAVEHGADAQLIAERLAEQYRAQGRPATLAVTVADALPREQGVTLLTEHLAEKPGDVAVFGRLVRLLLDEGEPDEADRLRAIRVTTAAMAEQPDEAERYAQALLQQAGDPADWLPAFESPELGPDGADHPAEVATLHGLLLDAAGRADDAAEAFRRALTADADASLARLRLAGLATGREDYAEADRLLEPLADSDDPPRHRPAGAGAFADRPGPGSAGPARPDDARGRRRGGRRVARHREGPRATPAQPYPGGGADPARCAQRPPDGRDDL